MILIMEVVIYSLYILCSSLSFGRPSAGVCVMP